MKLSSRTVIAEIKALDMFQKILAYEGIVPDIETLWLIKYRAFLQYTGALIMGIFVSSFTLLFIFIVFNMVLHVNF